MTKTDLYILMFLMLATLTGCKDEEDAVVSEKVTADLVFSVSASAEKQTRMTEEVVQASVTQTSAYRGIQDICLIPFKVDAPIPHGATPDFPEDPINGVIGEESGHIDASSWFYFYNHSPFTTGVKSFLIYGRAVPTYGTKAAEDITNEDKATNGSLVVNYVDERPENIGFHLEPIYQPSNEPLPEGQKTPAQKIADYLTYIAETDYEEGSHHYYWKTAGSSLSEDDPSLVNYQSLENCYNNFIAKETNVTTVGKYFAGSSPNIKALVNALYDQINALSGGDFNDQSKEAYKLKNAILDRIHSSTYVTVDNDQVTELKGCDDYPASYGLPDGSAALQWVYDVNEFQVRTHNTTQAEINDITRYAYPPELYYRTNSALKAMGEMDMNGVYAETTWSGVLSHYAAGVGGTDVIAPDTKSVVVVNPLQYAVGHLQLNFRAEGATLKDNDNVDITIGTTNFPLTGIIVGSQRPVDFEFKPVNSEADVRFSYDKHVGKKDGNTTATCYLKHLTGDSYEGSVNSLALQTPDDEDVYILLEFRNNSGVSFKGYEGDIIYPGCKFYLLGKAEPMDKPDGTDTRLDYQKRVFTQDHTTIVNIKVTSLKEARNTVPNILSEKLEVGVLLTLQWDPATPTNVQLKE